MDKEFVLRRACQILEEHLTEDSIQKFDKKYEKFNSASLDDGFTFSERKKCIFQDIEKIKKCDLLKYKNKEYAAYIFSRLNECITVYVQKFICTDFECWPLTEECSKFDVLTEDDYELYCKKYFKILQNSLWEDDYKTICDSAVALEALTNFH